MKIDSASSKKFIDNLIQNGFPPDWKNIKDLNSVFTDDHIGWTIPVSHQPTTVPGLSGMGVFAEQDVKQGDVLRVGRLGKNIIEIDSSLKNLPKFEKNTRERASNLSETETAPELEAENFGFYQC